ncbi:hypothetical protein COJ71_22425 [Bacillus cereus]|nr:hypothetical protein COJ71_22425 [Bacillus cereus]
MILNGFQHDPLYFFKREHLLGECSLSFAHKEFPNIQYRVNANQLIPFPIYIFRYKALLGCAIRTGKALSYILYSEA